MLESGIDSVENSIQEFELVLLPFVEHDLATLVHFSDFSGISLDGLLQHNFKNHRLGLDLQQLVGILFLFLEMLVNLKHILETRKGAAPFGRLLPIKTSRRLFEEVLEMLIVNHKVLLA